MKFILLFFELTSKLEHVFMGIVSASVISFDRQEPLKSLFYDIGIFQILNLSVFLTILHFAITSIMFY